ncbi:MAG: FAD:protein FMN transferase [Verrucomicrobiae bacterium]|nr:FAD:protein FMN transferase [Verrucomicrobiae bacterium]
MTGKASEPKGRGDAHSLSPGERAGVRAGVNTELNLTPTHAGLHRFEFQQPHMGTLFAITLYAPEANRAREAAEAAFARIAALEQMMTDYDPESELMQLCQQPVGQPVRVSDELFALLQKGQRLAALTDGAFDVTIGPVVRHWRRARRTDTLPSPEALARAQAPVGWRKLKLNARHQTVTLTVPNMQLDLGGIAKGYAADQALAVLRSHGLKRGLVAASGDIAVGDPPPGQRGWRVGVGALDRGEDALARNLLLRNAAVSTSGDTEQFVEIGGKRYSHIVDPRTGLGLTERLQVSIVAKHATDTDSFATAVSVLGVERGLKLVESRRGMAAFILRKSGEQTEVYESRTFKRIPRAE